MEVTQLNINGIVVNKTDSEMSWRMIYDDNRVISIFQDSGITYSHHNIFVASTIEECETEIYVLNLEYNP